MSGNARLDKKGIACFLVITFAISWAIQFGLILRGVRFDGPPNQLAQMLIAFVVMPAPAVAAIVTAKWITREGLGAAGIRFGSWKPYVLVALVIPAGYVAIYGLSWALGLVTPDWEFDGIRRLIEGAGGDTSALPSPWLLALALGVVSVFAAPVVNSIFGFGEELGWRGYLLPKLMPLGKVKAYVLVNTIWAIWHAPIIAVGFGFGEHPVAGVVVFCLLLNAFGVCINELTVRYRSSVLAGWVHGVFNSQAYGLLPVLFIAGNPVLGGKVGIVAAAVWGLVGLATVAWFRRREATTVDA